MPSQTAASWYANNTTPQNQEYYALGGKNMKGFRKTLPGGMYFSDAVVGNAMWDRYGDLDKPWIGVRDYAQALKNSGSSLNDYFGMKMASGGSDYQARVAFAADQQRRSAQAYNNYMGMKQWDIATRQGLKQQTLGMIQSDSLGRMALKAQRMGEKKPTFLQQMLMQGLNIAGTIGGDYLGARMNPGQTEPTPPGSVWGGGNLYGDQTET